MSLTYQSAHSTCPLVFDVVSLFYLFAHQPACPLSSCSLRAFSTKLKEPMLEGSSPTKRIWNAQTSFTWSFHPSKLLSVPNSERMFKFLVYALSFGAFSPTLPPMS